jgi:NAD(P)-dependent dehydrogenase (short-subunit alcohol dehydrogenase family)
MMMMILLPRNVLEMCGQALFKCSNREFSKPLTEISRHNSFLLSPSQIISIITMPANYDIGGKVIALTGGASGIGLQTAILLASQGAIVSMADMSEGPLKEAATKIQSTGGKVLATVVDVRDDKQVDAWIKTTVENFGKLDGAVNLAGVIPKCINIERVEDLNNEDWKFVLDVNLTGVMYCMRAELQNMNLRGSVVNAASICGVIGFPKNAAYTASKHAVIGLSRAAAKEVGDREIRINCIAP